MVTILGDFRQISAEKNDFFLESQCYLKNSAIFSPKMAKMKGSGQTYKTNEGGDMLRSICLQKTV
jgi:hypothetical protein